MSQPWARPTAPGFAPALPAGQATHATRVSVLAYLPDAQGVHAVALALVEILPGEHA